MVFFLAAFAGGAGGAGDVEVVPSFRFLADATVGGGGGAVFLLDVAGFRVVFFCVAGFRVVFFGVFLSEVAGVCGVTTSFPDEAVLAVPSKEAFLGPASAALVHLFWQAVHVYALC